MLRMPEHAGCSWLCGVLRTQAASWLTVELREKRQSTLCVWTAVSYLYSSNLQREAGKLRLRLRAQAGPDKLRLTRGPF